MPETKVTGLYQPHPSGPEEKIGKPMGISQLSM